MSPVRNAVNRARQYDRLTNIGEIARRYFAMNAFDGVLTIIGVQMGSMAVGVNEPRIVVSTGLATCVAMGISGLWGAYLAELSQQTLTNLHTIRIGRASGAAAVTVAFINGLAQFLSALVVLIPFFVADLFPVIA